MPDNRVDTTRPEYSWIPFFEELARRLHEDGWRERQGEIVAELQRMLADGLTVTKFVNQMVDLIDPFSIFAMIRRIGFDEALKLMTAYQGLFNLTEDLPTVEMMTPSVNPMNSLFFSGIPELSQVDPHWELFNYVMSTESSDLEMDVDRFATLLNASVAVKGAGKSTVTGALYWVQPHRFLKDDTIRSVLGTSFDDRGRRFGLSYTDALRIVRQQVDEPFPSVNVREWLLKGFRDDPHAVNRTVWQCTAERNQEDRERYLQGGYVGFGWTDADLTVAHDRDAVRKLTGLSSSPLGDANNFALEMRSGDVVVIHSGQTRTYRWGIVNADRGFFDPSKADGADASNRRGVSWMRDPVRLSGLETGHFGTLTRRSEVGPGVIGEILDSLEGPAPIPENGEDGPVVAPTQPEYTIVSMLDEGVFLGRAEIDSILSLLQRKQNLILQGPPGTGKTFIAKRLAYALLEERADDRIASVQFHQSYSYEDFVGGFRPGLNGGQLVFEAKDGAFLRLCEKARENPDDRYVMLVDEINRGNLSRVFGELLMLIESDKREERHAVELQHREQMPASEPTFYVPPNVYIIGTMNLADRSLTGMNVAMRRRFAFRELMPQFNTDRFKSWIADTGMPDEMQVRIRERMATLNQSITADPSLGKQYAVGHSFFCPGQGDPEDGDWEAWYRAVVEHEIRPLLEEYWFDQPQRAKEESDGLLAD